MLVENSQRGNPGIGVKFANNNQKKPA